MSENSEAGGAPLSHHVAVQPRIGGRLLIASSLTAQLCAFARYAFVARLLGPDQLGLAASMILTSQFFDSVSDSGSDRFVIQDVSGDAPESQKLAHLVILTRGVLTAVIMCAACYAIAAYFRSNTLVVGIIILSLYPLIMGTIHLDLKRAQRRNDFRTEALAQLFGEFCSMVVAVAAAAITRSYVCVVLGLVARALVATLVSHLRSERSYRLGYDAQVARRLAAFAGPLILNGMVLFIGAQGDRALIANQLGTRELGLYSAVLLLIFNPSAIISRYLGAVHLPQIAAGARSNFLFKAGESLIGQTQILALAMAFGFTLVAPAGVVLIYGSAFHQPVGVIALIGALQVLRFARLWPTTLALAAGRTGIVLGNNLVRLVGFALAFAAARKWHSLDTLTVGFAVGEFCAFSFAIVALNRAEHLPLAQNLGRAGALAGFCAALVGVGYCVDLSSLGAAAAFALIAACCAATIMYRERKAVLSVIELVEARAGWRRA